MKRPALLLALVLSACRPDASPDGPLDAPTPPTETMSPPDSAGIAPLYPATQPVEAPDFRLQTLSGESFRLAEQRGKVVVLNLWATWCGPCREEIPDFMALHEELSPHGLVVAGVSLDESGWDVVRPYAESLAINYPILVDDGTVAEAYGPVSVMPTTFVIDRAGNVAYYAPGKLTREALRPALLDLLAD